MCEQPRCCQTVHSARPNPARGWCARRCRSSSTFNPPMGYLDADGLRSGEIRFHQCLQHSSQGLTLGGGCKRYSGTLQFRARLIFLQTDVETWIEYYPIRRRHPARRSDGPARILHRTAADSVGAEIGTKSDFLIITIIITWILLLDNLAKKMMT